MIQHVDGRDVFVVVLTESPVTLLPITDGGNPFLSPYAQALTTAIVTGVVREPGKYGVEIDAKNDRWNIFKILE